MYSQKRWIDVMGILCLMAMFVGFIAWTPAAVAEDGVYLLEKGRGLHRVGNTPAVSPGNLPENVVDFEITEDGRGVYVLDETGQIITQGAGRSFKGSDMGALRARRMAVSKKGYAVLDELGNVHFGDGQEDLGWKVFFGWDIARDIELNSEGDGLAVLDGFGGLHIKGNLPELTTPYFGYDIARDVEMSPDGKGYYVLDGFGLVHSAGPVPAFKGVFLGEDIARDLEITQTGRGAYILDGHGGLHVEGDALPFELPFFMEDLAADIEVSPEPLASLAGQVLYENSEGQLIPVRRAKVMLFTSELNGDQTLPAGDLPPDELKAPVRTFSDEEGHYAFESLPAHSYHVRVSAPGYEKLESEVTLTAGENTLRDFVLVGRDHSVLPPPDEEYGVVEGSVAEDVGLLGVYIPIAKARVDLFINNRRVLSTRTNENGEFRFERVPEGVFPIRAEARGYYRAHDEVEVIAGQTAGVALRLKPRQSGSGRVYGVVWTEVPVDCTASLDIAGCTPERMPVPGALLHLVPLDERIMHDPVAGDNIVPEPETIGWTTGSGPDGRYEFDEIPFGHYTLIVKAEGYQIARRTFVLGEDCLDVEAGVVVNPDGPDNMPGMGSFEMGYRSAARFILEALHDEGLSATDENPLMEKAPGIEAELHEMLANPDCAPIGLVGGWFHDINQQMKGRWFAPDGHQMGVLKGEYGEGSFHARGIENGSNRQYDAAGIYVEDATWGMFDGDWHQVFPEVPNPRNGRLFGLWVRVSNLGGYFLGLWTDCTVTCGEKEINIQLYPLLQDFGRIHGNVSAVSDSTLDIVPLPGALVQAIPLNVPSAYDYRGDGEQLQFEEDGILPLHQFTTRTDENGDYGFERLPAGLYRLVVMHRGYENETREVELPPEGELEEDFILNPVVVETGAVQGFVYGVTDSATAELASDIPAPATVPLDGAWLMLVPKTRPVPVDPGNGMPRKNDERPGNATPVGNLIEDMQVSHAVRKTTSAADGSYSFADVPAGRYEVIAKARGYWPARRPAEVIEDVTTAVDFFLRPRPELEYGSLVGSVTDTRTGEPVPRAVVTAWPMIITPAAVVEPVYPHPGPVRTLTNDNGDYKFPKLPVGLYRVTVRARGYEPAARRTRIRADETSVLNFGLRPVPPPGSVVGQVNEQTSSGVPGGPIENARVTMIPFDLAIAEKASNGQLDESTDPAGHIYRTRTNARGWYEFPEVPAGAYLIRVQKHGYEPARRHVRVEPGTTLRQDFHLTPVGPVVPGTLLGTVYALFEGEEDPRPLPGAYVFAFQWREDQNTAQWRSWTPLHFARTDREGEYEFEKVRPGSYLVLAYAPGFEVEFHRAEVYPDEITQQNFFLSPEGMEPGAKISGHVYEDLPLPGTEDELPPVPRAMMLLYRFHGNPPVEIAKAHGPEDMPGPPWRTTWTNEDGYYEFEELDGGQYVLFALKPGYTPGTEAIPLPENTSVEVDFELRRLGIDPEGGMVEGHVFESSGSAEEHSPVEGALVKLMRGSGAMVHTRTDEDGYFLFADVPAGDYEVVAMKEGYEADSQTLSVAPGDVVQAELVMSPEGSEDPQHGRLVGDVWMHLPGSEDDSNSGRLPVPNARVSLSPDSYRTFAPIETRTDGLGRFAFEHLRADGYTLTVEEPGFETVRVRIHIEAGKTLRKSIGLRPMFDDILPEPIITE